MVNFDTAKALSDSADTALTRLIRKGVQFDDLLGALSDYSDAMLKTGVDSIPCINRINSHWYVIQSTGWDEKQCASLQEAIFEYLDRLIVACASKGHDGHEL